MDARIGQPWDNRCCPRDFNCDSVLHSKLDRSHNFHLPFMKSTMGRCNGQKWNNGWLISARFNKEEINSKHQHAQAHHFPKTMQNKPGNKSQSWPSKINTWKRTKKSISHYTISSNILYNAQQPKQLQTGGTRKKREREKENKRFIHILVDETAWSEPSASFWIHVHLLEFRQWKGSEEYTYSYRKAKKEMWNIFGGQSKQCILFMYNCRKLRSLVLLALAPHVDTCHFVGGTNVIPDQPIRIQSWVRGWPNVNNGQSKLLKRQI